MKGKKQPSEAENSWGVTILGLGILVSGIIFISGAQSGQTAPVTIAKVGLDGAQVIDITAGRGYYPNKLLAEAGKETVLRVTTKGVYDCSLSLNIPAIGYRDVLPPTGVKEIRIPPQKAGAVMRGMCSMGMYGFVINFK